MSATFAPALLALALCAAPAPAPAGPVQVAIVPLGGTAAEADRARATEAVVATVGGLEGLRAVSLAAATGVLGPQGEAELAACRDDACLVEKTRVIRASVLVAGSLDVEGAKTLVRLRLVDTSSAARGVLVRVAREVTLAPEVAFQAAIGEAVAELFPAEAARSFASLVVTGAPAGAAVVADGRLVADPVRTGAGAPVRLRAGAHHLRVIAPGHRAWEGDVELTAGQRRELEVELSKNRSHAPWVLGALGAVAGGVGLGLGAAARSTADGWRDACPGTASCAQGYTRARYDADQAAVDRLRVSANGLFVVSAVALGAGVVWYLLDPGVDLPDAGGAR